MQIYRLLKAGAFRLGTLNCYRWAKTARTRTGADIPPGNRAAKYRQLIDLKFPVGARRARYPAGLPHLGSRLLGVREKEVRREKAAMDAANPQIAKRGERITRRLIYRLNKRPISTLQLAAERLGDPMGQNDDSFNPGDRRRAAVAERFAEEGASRVSGVLRWSRKHLPFADIQLKANDLAATRPRVSYRMLAGALGVSASTLSRWFAVGHLKQFKPMLQLAGYGASVVPVENLGDLTNKAGGKTPLRPFGLH